MPEHISEEYAREMERIYNDTSYFIDGITEGYGFYGDFIRSMQTGNASLKLNRRTVHKRIEEQWLSAIESCLPVLDIVTRNYTVGIEEREEVMPIEFSRNINNRSIRHLSQHTDYITSFDGENITPSKILNVINEETMQTYENKFVNTLIQRLFDFVERRYSAIAGRGTEETGVQLDFESKFLIGSSEGRISFSIGVTDPEANAESDGSFARLVRIRKVLANLLQSSFVKNMQGAFVRPPVMRTNAIMKNKYLRQCMDLWDYIESYEKVGYVLDVEEKAEKPGDEYIKELYSLLSLQYMIFDYNVRRGFNGFPDVVAARDTDEPLTPNIVTKIKKVQTDEYNVYDTEYRRVVNVSQLSGQRRLSEGELQVRNAVETALTAQRKIENMRSREQRKRKKTITKAEQ